MAKNAGSKSRKRAGCQGKSNFPFFLVSWERYYFLHWCKCVQSALPTNSEITNCLSPRPGPMAVALLPKVARGWPQSRSPALVESPGAIKGALGEPPGCTEESSPSKFLVRSLHFPAVKQGPREDIQLARACRKSWASSPRPLLHHLPQTRLVSGKQGEAFSARSWYSARSLGFSHWLVFVQRDE